MKAVLANKYGPDAPELFTAIICHSMGNYLMSMTLVSGNVHNYAGAIDCVLMLAPDVDYSIFTANSQVLDQGLAIYRMANGHVAVFWSWKDQVLQGDEWLGMWCVLGYRGPKLKIDRQVYKVAFYQYTAVEEYSLDEYLPAIYPTLPINTYVHSAYRFVPFLLSLEVAFLAGISPGLIAGTVKEKLKGLIDTERMYPN